MGHVADWNRQSMKKGAVQKFADGGEVENRGTGLAPHGFRHVESLDDQGGGPKGSGYFGPLPNKNGGVSTEISTSDESGSYPLLTPNLTKEERQHLLDNKEPTEAIYKKARDHADMRRKDGKSPFASNFNELRYPKD